MVRTRDIRVLLMVLLRLISAPRPHSPRHHPNNLKNKSAIYSTSRFEQILRLSRKGSSFFLLLSALSDFSRFLFISTQSALHLSTTYSNLNVTEARVRISSMQCDARNLKRSLQRTTRRASQSHQPNNSIGRSRLRAQVVYVISVCSVLVCLNFFSTLSLSPF
jgi:hypothetical protein